MKNPMSDENKLLWLVMYVSEFMESFWVIIKEKYYKMCKIDPKVKFEYFT